MSRAHTRVLLVEDSSGDVVLAQRALELGDGGRFALTVVGTLGASNASRRASMRSYSTSRCQIASGPTR